MPFWTKFFIYSISSVFWYMPTIVRWWFACSLGWFWFDVLKLRRFTILRNLTIAFPDWDRKKKYQVARQSMRFLCYNLPEFMMLPKMTSKYVEDEVTFHGLENYEEALKKKKGVLFLSLHLGNGDMGISVLTLKGIRAHLITKKISNKFLNDFWFKVRETKGAKFIDPHGSRTAFEILGACRKNEGVVFVIDQYMGKPFGIETTFFGHKVGTAYGLALFAIKTGAPVLPLYTYRDEKLRTHVSIESEVPLVEIEDRDLQIKTMTQKYNDRLESIVKKHPEHWMWVHRRWKKWK